MSAPTTTAPTAKVGFFPLDRRLNLTKHSWSPETLRMALGLAADIASFERAAATFRTFTHLPLSRSSLANLSQEYGGRLVAVQAAEAEAMVTPPPQYDEAPFRRVPAPDSEVMVVSLDGAMIHVRDEGWKEVKIAAVSAVEEAAPAQSAASAADEPPVRLTKHSYRAGLWEAATFANQQWAEAAHRGIEKAKCIVSVNDGAVWIWAIVALCYTPCVEILDWWHAVQKLWLMATVLFGESNELGKAWVAQQKALLWAGQLRSIFHQVHAHQSRGKPWPDDVRQALGYLYHNRHRLRYQQFRQKGYPIGSGSVESACKIVVEARLKQAGMRWSRSGAQAMLALRSTVLSDRWDDVWPTLTTRSKAA